MSTQAESLDEKFKLVADTIRAYPLQLKQSWDEISSMYIPEEYKSVENVVFCGMGGSALGARMVDAFAAPRLRVPFEIFTEYNLPNYVNKNSLVIVSSYSGSTEETLEAIHQAYAKKAKVFGITTGGKLSEILIENKSSSYVFDPVHNPSGQPRMSIGYASGALLALLSKLGFVTITEEEVERAIAVMNEILTEFNENAPAENNLARSYANNVKGKAPIFVASEHLIGVVHTIKNQFNESAKTFSALFDLPELNHHLMEGLKNPSKLRDIFHFVFINSSLYSDRIQKRYPLTAEVLEKNAISYSIYSPRSDSKLSQVYETLIFGSFAVYFLTKEYGIDPMAIPWVDYFKEKLKK